MSRNLLFLDVDGVLNHWHIGHPGVDQDTDPGDWLRAQILGVTVYLSPTVLEALHAFIAEQDLKPVWATTWINFPQHLDILSETIEPYLPGSKAWDRIGRIEAMWGASGKLPGIIDYVLTGDYDSAVVLDDMFTTVEAQTLNEYVECEYVAPKFFLTTDHLSALGQFINDRSVSS